MENKINKHNVKLDISAGFLSQIPDTNMPQVALAGKSNVGKSSLINAILNRINFARTSSAPGKTRTINFYNLDEKVYLVDLPGYGYAKIAKDKKEAFSSLIEGYLNQAPQLSKIILLIDIRHAPGANDKMMLGFVRDLGYKPIIVLTKKDKLSRNEAIKNIAMIKKELNLDADDIVIPFSSSKKEGIEEVWNLIAEEANRE